MVGLFLCRTRPFWFYLSTTLLNSLQMKKIYSTLAFLTMIGGAVIAQSNVTSVLEKTVNTSKFADKPVVKTGERGTYLNTPTNINERGGLACAFDEDFDGGSFPAGWQNITNNANENWTYSPTDGNPDGHMDIAYDGPPPGQQNESLITPLIDFTSIPNPTLKFDWFMSYYWGVDPFDNYDLTISISSDGINWTDIWTETDFGGEFDTYEWYTTNVNMSAYSTWSTAVLRFNYNGFDGAQAKFDNISVCSAQNDLRVTSVMMGDVINDYAYSQIPVSQSAEIISGVIFENAGGTSLTNISLDAALFSFVANANVSVGTIAGPAVLAPGEIDTVWVATGYVPAMVDTLIQDFVASSDQVDVAPTDNEGFEVLLITQDTWAHDYELEDYFAFGYESGGALGSSGFEMGAQYFCQTSGSTIYAVDFPLGDATTAQSITIKIYEIDVNGATVVSSTLYDILPGDLSTTTVNFINVPLDVPVGMTAGNVYRATISIEPGDDAFILGNNLDDGDGGHVLYQVSNTTWYNWVGLTTAMRLRVSSVVEVAENDGLSTLEIYPNPASDIINVNFVSEVNDVVTVNVLAVDGKMVHTVTISAAVGQSTKLAMDASQLNAGVYSIQIIGEQMSTVKRVVVQ